MTRDALSSSEDDPDLTPPGPFDGPPPDAGAPTWFVPDDEAAGAPWQTAPPRIDGETDWAALERRHAAQLADAALHVGALDTRIRHLPPGVRRHLIRVLVADLSWHLGARVTVDRLGLYMADRLGGSGSDAPDLARAAWATRRLDRGDHRAAGMPADDPQGDDAAVARWRADLPPAGGLHPFTRAAAGWEIWRREALSGESAPVEGAVMVMLLGGEPLRPGGLGLLPVSFAPGLARRVPDDRLAGWLDGIAQGALAGLMLCDRLDAWRARAARRTRDLSGRTPPRLIEALLEWPLASAPMLERATGASRAAVQRNMARLESRGLAEEITGQSRFRFWRPALDTRPAV